MTWQVLIQSDVEPYETITRLLDEADCNLHWWRDVEPPHDADYAIIDGIYSYGHFPVTPELMKRCGRLKVVSNFGVGCDHIDRDGAKALGIPVGNTPGVLDAATADLTWALLLAAGRNIVCGDHFARGPDFHHYDAAFMLGQQVTGATLGIIGLGRIGYQVARRAVGFDMEILYHNRGRNEKAEADFGARYVSLDELLGKSDFVALNCPLTPETTGLPQKRIDEMREPLDIRPIEYVGPSGLADISSSLQKNGELDSGTLDQTDLVDFGTDEGVLDELRQRLGNF